MSRKPGTLVKLKIKNESFSYVAKTWNSTTNDFSCCNYHFMPDKYKPEDRYNSAYLIQIGNNDIGIFIKREKSMFGWGAPVDIVLFKEVVVGIEARAVNTRDRRTIKYTSELKAITKRYY